KLHREVRRTANMPTPTEIADGVAKEALAGTNCKASLSSSIHRIPMLPAWSARKKVMNVLEPSEQRSRISVLEICWRREVDSNFEYRFGLCANVPCVSELYGS